MKTIITCKIITAVSYFSKRFIVDAWQGSEYASNSKYPRVLNSPGFWICFCFWMCQSFGYTRVLNISLVLNMPGFLIHQSSKYTRVKQGSEYTWIISKYAWICRHGKANLIISCKDSRENYVGSVDRQNNKNNPKFLFFL